MVRKELQINRPEKKMKISMITSLCLELDRSKVFNFLHLILNPPNQAYRKMLHSIIINICAVAIIIFTKVNIYLAHIMKFVYFEILPIFMIFQVTNECFIFKIAILRQTWIRYANNKLQARKFIYHQSNRVNDLITRK